MRPDLLGHVKWFTDPAPHPTDWALLLSGPVLVAFAIALVAVAVAAVVQRTLPEPHAVRSLERFAGWGRPVLGAHVGIALVAAAALGMLFTPALHPAADGLGRAILVVEALCGVLLLAGAWTRPASVLLALLGIVAMQPFTFESILENVHILGIAMFFFLVGRGRLSIDRLRNAGAPIEHRELPHAALTLLRVMLGFGIAFTSLTEKLLDPGLAQALLDERPYLNVGRLVGIGDPQFAYLAGLVELTVGAVVMSGQLTRPAMAVGAVLFTATLPFFGWTELLGHLPFYGIMFVLFIAPNADSWRVRRQLRPAA